MYIENIEFNFIYIHVVTQNQNKASETELIATEVKGQSTTFSNSAKEWWNPNGPMKALHAIHKIRMQYIFEQLLKFHPLWKNEDNNAEKSIWKNTHILDFGCGGGLIAEPLARLGGKVTGVDSNEDVLEVAKYHAKLDGTEVEYKLVSTSSSLTETFKNHQKFDIVLLLEVIEHVPKNLRQELINDCASVLKPNGLLIVSTINRSLKAKFTTITLAENILRIVPKGTHNWRWYVKPNELSLLIQNSNLVPKFFQSLSWNIAKGWQLMQKDSPINYFMTAQKVS